MPKLIKCQKEPMLRFTVLFQSAPKEQNPQDIPRKRGTPRMELVRAILLLSTSRLKQLGRMVSRLLCQRRPPCP